MIGIETFGRGEMAKWPMLSSVSVRVFISGESVETYCISDLNIIVHKRVCGCSKPEISQWRSSIPDPKPLTDTIGRICTLVLRVA